MTDPFYEHYLDDRGIERVRRRAGGEVCDFCLEPDPAWTYPAALMEVIGHPVITHSDDEWGACDECHRLIEAHDLGGLVERTVTMQPRHHPPDPLVRYPPLPLFRRLARRNILRFMDARTGPPWHGTPEDHASS